MEGNEGFTFWRVDYISCESNTRWAVAKAPSDWSEEYVLSMLQSYCMGGCGDEPAMFTGVQETSDTDYLWDLHQYE